GDERERQEQKRERPRPRPQRPCPAAAPCLVTREVGDELVELGVGLRRQAALETGLKLVDVQTSFQACPPHARADRPALRVAGAQAAVARTVARVVSVLTRCWLVRPFDRFVHSSLSSSASTE